MFGLAKKRYKVVYFLPIEPQEKYPELAEAEFNVEKEAIDFARSKDTAWVWHRGRCVYEWYVADM